MTASGWIFSFFAFYEYLSPRRENTKINLDWIPRRRRKRRRPRKTWMEGEQAAMTTRNLDSDQWRDSDKGRLASGRRRQLLRNRLDR